jgi:hypothetical protein
MRPRRRAACSVCRVNYAINQDGMVGRHYGMDTAGFSTGEPCPGVGEPGHDPTPAPSAPEETP